MTRITLLLSLLGYGAAVAGELHQRSLGWPFDIGQLMNTTRLCHEHLIAACLVAASHLLIISHIYRRPR